MQFPAVDRSSSVRRFLGFGAVVAVAVGAGILAVSVQRSGHFWGDDFALYIHQALSIRDGSWQQVIDDNRFALDRSGWNSFSPLAYPWGFPLLLAPLLGDWGFDYDALKVVGTASMALFVFGLDRLMIPRLGYWPALALAGLFAVSLPFLRMAETIQSDLPHAAFAMLALWAIDATHRGGRWQGQSRARLIGLGVLVAWVFTIRREGLALVAAIVACQALEVVARPRRGPVAWGRLVLPHLVFVGSVWALQLVLPSVIAPHYPGTGPGNVPINALSYLREFAVHIGLSRPGASGPEVFGNARVGWMLALPVAVCLVAGAVTVVRRHLRRDLAILAFFGATAGLVLQLPFRDARYVLTLTPLLAWLAVEGALVLIGRWTGTLRAGAVTAVLVGIAVVTGAVGVIDVAGSVAARNASGVQLWGPTDPAALELWEAVESYTDPDDVVAFFRSRLMTLQTGRRSLQSGRMEPILDHADWFAWEKDSGYSQPDPPEVAAGGLETVWENGRFALLRIEAETE